MRSTWPLGTMPDHGAPAATIMSTRGVSRSEDMEDIVDRSRRLTPAGRHADDAIEKPVLLRRGLEARRSAEVILAGLDLLALVERLDHPGRAVPHAIVVHVDQMVVVRLEREAHVQHQDAVAPLQQPVATRCRQDGALDLLALEGAALDRGDASTAVRRLAEIDDVGIDLERQGEEMGGAERRLGHDGL